MKRICVFCGSGSGASPSYARAAKNLGHVLAERKIALVYGGAGVGLMGELAKAVLETGGEVIGIIPSFMVAREVPITSGLTDLRIVSSMHERKALMEKLSDGFIALPGGLGTLEELFEILTWAQLGMHRKPCGLLNAGNYYDKLIEFLDTTVVQKLVRTEHRSMLMVEEDPEVLLERFGRYEAPAIPKWINGKKT